MIRCLILTWLLVVVAGGPANRTRLQRVFPDRRIVGGFTVTIGQFPYQLSMERGGRLWCGASIVTTSTAITAGHCVYRVAPKEISLRSGSSFKENGGTSHAAAEIQIHDSYDDFTTDFDVALVFVSNAFVFDASRQPISVTPAGTMPETDASVTISGWGATSEGGSAASQLQALTIDVVEWSACNAAYAEFGGLTSRMFCAGSEGRDSCQGDSGGPVVYGGVLVGIVSFGVGCARRDYPGVYTNLHHPDIRSWVKTHSGV